MTEFGAISYAAVGVLYAMLSILLLTSWRGRWRRPGGYLIAACLFSTVWATTLAIQMSGTTVPLIAVFAAEVLRSATWLAFLIFLLSQIGVSRYICFFGHAAWIGILVAGLGLWVAQGFYILPGSLAAVLNPGGLLLAFVGLLLVEQLYGNSEGELRWGIKPLALGLGGLFAYDLFLYSQGLLFGAIDTTAWTARGAVNILFVPLIAIAARRNPNWNLNIFVSRQIIFYSTSLIAVGLYLLLMGVGGYALLIYGGTWGVVARFIFFVGAILVLIILLFSSTLRARVKVFLSKHFFHNKYDYREEWLRLTSTLAGFEDSSTRQIVIKALAQIVDSPAGMLWVFDDKQRFYQTVAAYETTESAPNIAADDSLIGFITETGWLIDLEEFRRNPKHYADLLLPDWLSESDDAWLVIPLTAGQELLGLALLYKAPGPPALNYEDRDLLKTVGNHIAVHLAQEKTDSLLAEARQFEAYNRLTAFLMHDLSNLIAQQSLLVTNAGKHKRNPDFVDDAMNTIANSVERMKRIMDQLKRGKADSIAKSIELKFVVSAALDRCAGKEPVPMLELGDNNALVEADVEQFTMVLTHLIRNAQDSTPPSGSVIVSTERENGNAIVTVADSGSGMTPEFIRDRLFRPFDSTKGSQGMGIGAYQAREYARKMGGDLKVESKVSAGTTIVMILPLQ